jgi:NAD(P)-dependent dehydrogenase (short-subunit alcohol dehydrogenase family)
MESRSLGNSILKFANKTIVITGSGTGIGQAIAQKFAENGANIIILGRRKEPLEYTANVLNDIIRTSGSSGRVKSFSEVDVSDEIGINTMFKSIQDEFGKVDIIVNNAGVSGPVKTFTNADFVEFKNCVSIHLTGTFWTSIRGLQIMKQDGKIVTISTFFTEENRYEQRPYRFRIPYTASQGAKNRLAEALSWELAHKGIKSLATNPGPVHSDRIYKTVYPKAAAEFLRIGGYPDLSSVEVEKATSKILELLGESEDVVSEGIVQIAVAIARSRGDDSDIEIQRLVGITTGLMTKLKEIAEKVQNNTKKMIVDQEFLSQEEVAYMVMNLCDEKISKLINGRIVPNDRVFYPVKPTVATGIEIQSRLNLKGKLVVLSTTSSETTELERMHRLATALKDGGSEPILILANNAYADLSLFKDFRKHSINLLEEESVRRTIKKVKTTHGGIDALIHFTGNYDYNLPFLFFTRKYWDSLVDNFIIAPGLITKEIINAMAPDEALSEPSKYKGTKGMVILVGPDGPVGKKISGLVRARSEVFRGALRPYTATVNQELSDVLGSFIRLYLIFLGNIEGTPPNEERLQQSLLHLIGGSASNRNETIFYLDEANINS